MKLMNKKAILVNTIFVLITLLKQNLYSQSVAENELMTYFKRIDSLIQFRKLEPVKEKITELSINKDLFGKNVFFSELTKDLILGFEVGLFNQNDSLTYSEFDINYFVFDWRRKNLWLFISFPNICDLYLITPNEISKRVLIHLQGCFVFDSNLNYTKDILFEFYLPYNINSQGRTIYISSLQKENKGYAVIGSKKIITNRFLQTRDIEKKEDFILFFKTISEVKLNKTSKKYIMKPLGNIIPKIDRSPLVNQRR